jgi:hypothetical protein
MSSLSWVTSSLASRPEIFCWVSGGRRVLRCCSPADAGIGGEPEHAGLPGLAGLEELAARLLLHLVLRARDAGDRGQADGDGAAELSLQRLALFRGDGGKSLLARGVPGADEARRDRMAWLRPGGAGAGLGAVLEVLEVLVKSARAWRPAKFAQVSP